MSKDKHVVTEFTRGVMDRIRDHIKEYFPKTHEAMDTETELTQKIIKTGDLVSFVRKRHGK